MENEITTEIVPNEPLEVTEVKFYELDRDDEERKGSDAAAVFSGIVIGVGATVAFIKIKKLMERRQERLKARLKEEAREVLNFQD